MNRAAQSGGYIVDVKPLDFLQGKWLGHPLHPAIVHLPIGAWFFALVLDAAARLRPSAPTLPHLATAAVVFGLLAAGIAIPTGVAEWSPIKKEKPAWKLGLYHMVLNLLATLVWAVNLGMRWNAPSSATSSAVLVTSALGTLLVLISGYIGSRLTFDQGTSVARQSKKKWRAIAERGGANLPESR